MKQHFTRYEKAKTAAERELGIALVSEIQTRLMIARVNGDGEFSVCTGMGMCSIGADDFKVIYRDEEDAGPQDGTDDFELGEKLKKDGPYNYYVHCQPSTRKALLEVAAVCQQLTDEDIQRVLPYKVCADRIER